MTNIGIDAGGTLVKVAYLIGNEIKYQNFKSDSLGQVVSWLRNFKEPKLCITGGKSQVLSQELGGNISNIVEFEATCAGVEYLAKRNQIEIKSDFVLANIGTGTSIHYVSNHVQQRIGGTGVGGGTLIGLSTLLTNNSNYEQIVQSALYGNKDSVDLTVKDIFEGASPPISEGLTASNFGKINAAQTHPTNPDLLASVIALIGETVVTISSQAAERFRTESIVYIGSTLRSNPLLRKVIEDYTLLRGKKPSFLINGEFSGAVGALLHIAYPTQVNIMELINTADQHEGAN